MKNGGHVVRDFHDWPPLVGTVVVRPDVADINDVSARRRALHGGPSSRHFGDGTTLQTGAVSFLSGRPRPLRSISNEKVSAGLQYRRLMSNIGGPWQKYEPAPLLRTGRLISERADWASRRGKKEIGPFYIS
jgi:hypothetical protein